MQISTMETVLGNGFFSNCGWETHKPGTFFSVIVDQLHRPTMITRHGRGMWGKLHRDAHNRDPCKLYWSHHRHTLWFLFPICSHFTKQVVADNSRHQRTCEVGSFVGFKVFWWEIDVMTSSMYLFHCRFLEILDVLQEHVQLHVLVCTLLRFFSLIHNLFLELISCVPVWFVRHKPSPPTFQTNEVQMWVWWVETSLVLITCNTFPCSR